MLKHLFFVGILALSVSIASAQQPAAQPAGEETMVDSPFFKIGWPKVEMPKFSWKPSFGGQGDRPPVAAQQPGGNPVSRTLDRVADSSRRASDKVRNVWDSAVNRVASFGRSNEPQRVAKTDNGPGFWSRLFTPEEPRGSETVQEFLAQERVGTTR